MFKSYARLSGEVPFAGFHGNGAVLARKKTRSMQWASNADNGHAKREFVEECF